MNKSVLGIIGTALLLILLIGCSDYSRSCNSFWIKYSGLLTDLSNNDDYNQTLSYLDQCREDIVRHNVRLINK